MSRQMISLFSPAIRTRIYRTTAQRCISNATIAYASNHNVGISPLPKEETSKATAKPTEGEEPKPKKKTQAELDQELQLKLQGLAGDGGDAGIEYEDGKPVSMKRSVKNNMFRYI